MKPIPLFLLLQAIALASFGAPTNEAAAAPAPAIIPSSGQAPEMSPTAKASGPTARVSLRYFGAAAGAQLELRPYPSAYEKARLYLLGEEKAPQLTFPVERGSRSAEIELPLGFWQLVYRAGQERLFEAALTPLKGDGEVGDPPSLGDWNLRIVDEGGAPIPGAIVGLQATSFPVGDWQRALVRRESSAAGWVRLPRPARATLWVLAPGYAAVQQFFVSSNDFPTTLVIPAKTWRKLHLRDAFRRPLVDALIRSNSGQPLGFTDAEGELEGPFAERDSVQVIDARGQVWRNELIFRPLTGGLRVQVAKAEPIRGEVVDRETGDALKGAWVWLDYQKEFWCETDQRGQFEIFDTFPSPNNLRADAPGYSLGYAAVEPGDSPIQIRLAPSNRVLHGKVEDLAGNPLAGARVKVRSEVGKASWSATTNEEGEYRITGLPHEKLWAEAQKEFFLAQVRTFHRTFPEVRLDFQLERGGVVMGRVLAAPGAPTSQVQILRVVGDHDPVPLGQSDAEGFFAVGPLYAGRHKLVFLNRGSAKLELEVELAKGLAKIDLGTLELAAEEIWQGRVVDEDGAPLKDSRIFVWPGVRRNLEYAPSRQPDAVTGEDGDFVLFGLKFEQNIALEIRAAGRPPVIYEAVVRKSTERNWVVPEGARLKVLVRDPRHEPVFYANVELRREGNKEPYQNWEITDEQGMVEYPPQLAGEVELQVTADNFGIWRQKVLLEKGQNRKLVVVLGDEGEVLTGRILKSNGRPAAGYRVYLETGERISPPPVVTRVDAEGFYLLEGLPSGTVEVQVTSPSSPLPVHRQKVTLDQPRNYLDLQLAQTAVHAFGVLVEDSRGKPLAGVDVLISIQQADGMETGIGAKTEKDGTAIFPEVPEGEYTVAAQAPDATWKAAQAVVKIDRTSDLVLVLEKVESEAETNPEGPEP